MLRWYKYISPILHADQCLLDNCDKPSTRPLRFCLCLLMMVGLQLLASALFFTASSALPQPVRRQTVYPDGNATTINGTTYSLREVGARNTLVCRWCSVMNMLPATNATTGLADMAGKRRRPGFILARCSDLPRRVQLLHHQLCGRDPQVDPGQDRDQP